MLVSDFVLGVISIGALAAIAYAIWQTRDAAPRDRTLSPRKPAIPPDPAELARTKAADLARIDDFHGNELNAVTVSLIDCNIPRSALSEAKAAVQQKTQRGQVNFRTGNKGLDVGFAIGSVVNAAIYTELAGGKLESANLHRTLRDMSDADRAVLRLADILTVLGMLDVTTLRCIQASIVWGGGKCYVTYDREYSAKQKAGLDAGLRVLMSTHFGDTVVAHELVQDALRRAIHPDSDLAADDRQILERYLFAGSRWLTPNEIPASSSPSALKLGTFEGTDKDYDYDWNESLITVAPPGAGKSQAHVIRNLLNLRTPAVVLDIKGEAFKHTARWRKENVGPVFAFAPTMPHVSMHYNPLDGVGSGPNAWDAARKLADLLVIPGNGDTYFESRARDLITVALLDVATNEPADRRHIGSVIDRLYLNEEEFADWLDHLTATDVPTLKRQANAWRTMPNKQREAVFDSARNHLEAWQSPALAEIVNRSDWRPEQLRRENATLYLCINLEDVKKYASVIRVIIGQTITTLSRGDAETNATLVTFFLDEMPRLGRLDVIEEGLDTTRGHRVRFWIFCQNLGQLHTSYPNAQGMLGNCGARCFMDPDDEMAEELSRYLGQRKGLIDGKQKPLAEASELKGPAFADKVIVFTRGKSPAKLVRRMAFERELRAAE